LRVQVVVFGEDAALELGRIGTVLALRYPLVTNNLRHFSRVPGLALENWK